MQMFMCAMYDRATGNYGNPFFVVSKGQAVRSFQDEVNRKSDDNLINKHPGDFDLYYLGAYETENGEFIIGGNPERIATGADLVAR